MKITHIDEVLLKQCEVAAHAFILEKKQWQQDEYRLTFHYIEDQKNVAVFSAAHLEALYENRQRENNGKVGIHPKEFSLLVDIVDFSVQENTLAAVFRHEKKTR